MSAVIFRDHGTGKIERGPGDVANEVRYALEAFPGLREIFE